MAECTYCGGFVTDDYARVFGDNENRVDDCRNCPTRRPTEEEDEADDGREVLLREVEGTAGEQRESSESSGRAEPTPTAERADADSADDVVGTERGEERGGAEGRGERDRGRLKSGLDAMVSALRS